MVACPSVASHYLKKTVSGKTSYFANGTRVAQRKNYELSYIAADQLGSASVVVSATGELIGRIAYQPYGEEAARDTLVPGNPDFTNYTFTGKELDDTGAFYFGYRYYDAEVGRFLSADPIMLSMDYRSDEGLASYFRGSLNWYTYCSNNPVKYTDPDGMDPMLVSKYMWPVSSGFVTSAYGPRFNATPPIHRAIDVAGKKGEPILVGAGGVVTYVRRGWSKDDVNDPYGNSIEVTLPDGTVLKYSHLNSDLVSAGQKVTKGQQIGFLGESGNATGPHVDFEVIVGGKRIDPVPQLGERPSGISLAGGVTEQNGTLTNPPVPQVSLDTETISESMIVSPRIKIEAQ